MDRAEAIKWYENEVRLLEAAPNLNGINGSCMEEEWKKQAEIHKLALAALREQEQREQDVTDINVGNKWISVEERLPEDYEWVLVYLGENIGVLHTDTDRVTRNKKWVRWPGNVTHWMPLPMPPKEEEK